MAHDKMQEPSADKDQQAARFTNDSGPSNHSVSRDLLVCLEQFPQGRQVDHDKFTASIAFDDNAAALNAGDHPPAVAAKIPVG